MTASAPALASPIALVRYGLLTRTAEFLPRSAHPLPVGTGCVIETPRGIEFGRIVAALSGEGREVSAPLLRLASQEDLERANELEAMREEDRVRAQEIAGDQLSVIGIERLLGGEPLVLYYTSLQRVGVPELLADLKEAFGLEVRLVHIAARQRAALVGGCGPCGRSLCCSSFLRRMEPVSIRQAQVQGLDRPERSAGRCGRLKCCLRYESSTYEEQHRDLPRVGWRVETARLSGRVKALSVLSRQILVQPEQGRSRLVFAEEIISSSPPPKEPLPLVGEEPTTGEAEKGWSHLAKRLWRRFREDKDKDKEQE
jgi:cell fate regulator YaaT (PSP1 superfamily)